MTAPNTTLTRAFGRRLGALANSLRPSTLRHYRTVVRQFSRFLQQRFPKLQRADQLRRDPHILAWMEEMAHRQPPLSVSSRLKQLLCLRRLLDDLADLPHPPPPALIRREDLPRCDFKLPRPLTSDDDQRLQLCLRQRNDLLSNALLLQRGAGLRIGELADLAPDCLHHIGGDQWALRVPVGKLHSERWVPVDQDLRKILARLSFLRSLAPADPQQPFLLPRLRARSRLLSELRRALAEAASEAGCSVRPVTHQLRHTYASDMLRRGVSLIGVMKLLGHTTPRMTLCYIQVTQADLQREFRRALEHPRHQLPALPVPSQSAQPDVAAVVQALRAALHLLDCCRHHERFPKALEVFRRRLVKLVTVAEKLPAQEKR